MKRAAFAAVGMLLIALIVRTVPAIGQSYGSNPPVVTPQAMPIVPQIIASVSLLYQVPQNNGFNPNVEWKTLYVAKEDGLFRVSRYLVYLPYGSRVLPSFAAYIRWTDDFGTETANASSPGGSITVGGGTASPTLSSAILIAAKAGTPIQYQVQGFWNVYNAFLRVERL